MFQELFIVTFLGLSLSGCTIINKHQVKINPPVVKEAGEKIWVEAQTNKVWVNPHIDENGDMVDGHYKHIVMVPGHWRVKDDGKK